ncbi:hypothetical protein ACLOJK_017555 [Asimina triloba]
MEFGSVKAATHLRHLLLLRQRKPVSLIDDNHDSDDRHCQIRRKHHRATIFVDNPNGTDACINDSKLASIIFFNSSHPTVDPLPGHLDSIRTIIMASKVMASTPLSSAAPAGSRSWLAHPNHEDQGHAPKHTAGHSNPSSWSTASRERSSAVIDHGSHDRDQWPTYSVTHSVMQLTTSNDIENHGSDHSSSSVASWTACGLHDLHGTPATTVAPNQQHSPRQQPHDISNAFFMAIKPVASREDSGHIEPFLGYTR